jgi:hypothetical protein
VETDTPFSSILLAVEMDTPFSSILLVVEEDTHTPWTSKGGCCWCYSCYKMLEKSYVNAGMSECRKKVNPASAFLPLVI